MYIKKATCRKKGIRDHSPLTLSYEKQVDLSVQTQLDVFNFDREAKVSDKFTCWDDRTGMFHQTHMNVWSAEIILQKQNRWEIINLLEEACWEKRKILEYKPSFPDRRRIVYTLPTIGGLTGPNLWKKKSFDPTLIYIQQGADFLPGPNLVFETKLRRLKGKLKVSSRASYHVAQNPGRYPNVDDYHEFCKASRPSTKRAIQYAEIDLGQNKLVTHVGTMGKPFNVDRFYPPDDTEVDIFFITEQEKHWLTEYEVQIRGDRETKWTSLGIFAGNVNRTTERVHPVDCVARYYRFIPKEFVGSQSFQVALFSTGIPKIYHKSIFPHKQGYQIRTDCTLEYTVTFPSLRRCSVRQDSKAYKHRPRKDRRYHYNLKLMREELRDTFPTLKFTKYQA